MTKLIVVLTVIAVVLWIGLFNPLLFALLIVGGIVCLAYKPKGNRKRKVYRSKRGRLRK